MTSAFKKKPCKAVVWMKDDLRLHDNPAILAAFRKYSPKDILVIRSREGSLGHVKYTERRERHENITIEAMRVDQGQEFF